MELPFRAKGDELLPDGALLALRDRLKHLARGHDLTTVAAYAFDHRTRMLPFVFLDRRLIPGGVRMLASALLDIGFEKTRVVFQQWNRKFQPSAMRLDGRIPDMFLVSSMAIHGEAADKLLRDVCRIDPAQRPLVIAGGPRTNYQPWLPFGTDPQDPWGADVAATGETFVFLSLLEVLLEEKRANETLRTTFLRARDAGMLDHIPGLVYAKGRREGVAEELVDTGVQRLLGNLDELPHPVLGYRVLEAPSRKPTLASRALERGRVRKLAPMSVMEMTYGCKFRCPYCPIPAYNQHKDRQKSAGRIADEMGRIHDEYGIRYFFGADDNFFNRKDRAVEIIETLRDAVSPAGKPIRRFARWGTEVTVHDTLQMVDHLADARRAGVRALWLGVEDMTATLVKKGQSIDGTRAAFAAMREVGIKPMPMMMHDDTQPLLTIRSARGLLNQVQMLRSAGAMSLQVLLLSPAHGTKLYYETHESGLAYESVNGQPVTPHMVDGNHVVASRAKHPWLRQLNVLIAYTWFYNPVRLLWSLVASKSRRGWFVDAAFQAWGMAGLLRNYARSPRWMWHLFRGGRHPVRSSEVPRSPVPLRAPDGSFAAHDLPPGPDPKRIRRLETVPYDEVQAAVAAARHAGSLPTP
ncbi:MAG: radical SAM protein [Planctomycetota bacterium]